MYQNRITKLTPPSIGFRPAAWVANPRAEKAVQPGVAAESIYATAWNIARRDHEIDKLFNAAYFYDI